MSKGSGLFSWVLICGYIESFALGMSLTKIHLKRISAKILQMLNPSIPVKATEPRPMTEIKLSLKERTDKCDGIIDKIKDLDPEKINDSLIDNTSVRPKINNLKPYLGEKSRFTLPNKEKIRQIFKKTMKNAVNMILIETVTTSSTSIDDILLTFEKVIPNTTDWSILNLCPA